MIIRLITLEVANLQTKLKYVDIYNHWLRQAITRNQIHVDYVTTGDQLADGLTKALPAGTMESFRKQLRLVNVEEILDKRKLRELR